MSCPNFLNVFRHLLPTGRAFNLPVGSTIYKLFQGLSDEPERICEYINDTRDAGLPGSIPADALNEWENDLALTRNSSLTTAERNDRIVGKLSSVGGQGPDYIQDVIQNSGFDLYVYENNPISNPDVRNYTTTLGGVTLGSGATLGAYTDRIDPRTIPGTLIAGPDIYTILRNYSATLGGFTLGDKNLGEYTSNQTEAFDYEVPPIPSRYIFVWFLSGPGGLGDFVDVPSDRWPDLKRQILDVKPAHTWVIVQVNLV